MSKVPRIVLRRTKRGPALAMLFGVTPGAATWEAEGYYCPSAVRAGSTVLFEGTKLRLPRMQAGYFKQAVRLEVVNGPKDI